MEKMALEAGIELDDNIQIQKKLHNKDRESKVNIKKRKLKRVSFNPRNCVLTTVETQELEDREVPEAEEKRFPQCCGHCCAQRADEFGKEKTSREN
jgi:hypothetical protein